jgi:hypothetical protein
VSTTRYLVGVLAAALALGAITASAMAVRRRLLPAWSGVPARLAEVVVGLTIALTTVEALGLLGWFEPVPALIGAVGVSAAVWLLARRGDGARDTAPTPPAAPRDLLGRWAPYVGVASTVVVVSSWTARVAEAVRHGPTGIDTLWYHLPIAARFSQSGSITAAHYTDGDALAASFPANSALLHALGILSLDTDLATTVLNLAFLALALLAAWTIGRSFGVAWAAVVCLNAVLAVPVLVGTQPGGGYNDIIGIAMLLTACALLTVAGPDPPSAAVAVLSGLAAGFAIGTKYQFAVPVATLAIAVAALSPRGRRVRMTALWVASTLVTGSFWYARNAVLFDNPLPAVRVELGPITLPQIPSLFAEQSSFVSYIGDRTTWRDHLLPGLLDGLGPVWWLVFAVATTGVGLGLLAAGSRVRRMLALVGVGSLIGFAVSPSIHDAGGQPVLFAADLRYLGFYLALGAVLLPTALGRRAWWAIGVASFSICVTQLDPSLWPTDLRDGRFLEPVRGGEVLVGPAIGAALLVMGVLWVRMSPRARDTSRAPAVVVLGVLTLLTSLVVRDWYHDRRYADRPPIPELYEWALGERDERIGLAGDLLYLQYPFYGTALSNHVQYVGRTARHGSYFPITSCADWRRALNSGEYTYVVTASEPQASREAALDSPGPYADWTGSDPAAELVRTEVTNLDDRARPRLGMHAYTLFRITGRLDPNGCSD